MKKMKKLLGMMGALGFTTVAAINVVACNPQSGDKLNALTKSFNSAYTSDRKTEAELKIVGLKKQSGDTYNFSFDEITDEGIQSVIKKTSATAPVNKGITKSYPSKITADVAENDEIAQVVAKTLNNSLFVTGDQKTVQYVVTLKLWKADSNKRYVDQNTSMDVTININTIASLNTLVNLYDFDELNLNVTNLKNVNASDILASQDFKTFISNTLDLFAQDTLDSEYTVALASDVKGTVYKNLDLTSNTKTYMQISATKTPIHFAVNSKTAWIEVPLPAANNLIQLADASLRNLVATDFIGVDPSSVTKKNIIAAIKQRNTFLLKLQEINSNITAIDSEDSLNWIIATSFDGADMTDPIDVTKNAMTVYVTLTPGKIAFLSNKRSSMSLRIPEWTV